MIPTALLHHARRRHRDAGFSLVEVFIAMALTLLAMASVATLFGMFGRTVSQSQAAVDLNARIRTAASQLRQDLHGVTVTTRPWVRPEANAGYFEIVDGSPTTPDRLMATTTALGKPFVGPLQVTTGTTVIGFESPFAEVVWFCRPTSPAETFAGQTLYNLYRRQLFVSASPAAGLFANGGSQLINRSRTDLSCGNLGSKMIPNSLADLSRPANRIWAVSGSNPTLSLAREGEDIILGNVITFDFKALKAGEAAYTDQSFNTNYQDGVAPTAGAPLLGVEVRIRCVDPSSKQVRQITVVHTFEGL